MFSFDASDMPTEHELALIEEQRLFDTLQHAQRFPRVGAAYNERVTCQLMSVWKTMLDGIHESTRQVTEALMSLPTSHIGDLLSMGANPQAVDAMQLIAYLPTIGTSVSLGQVSACELLTQLVSAGYRMSGDEIDALVLAFDQQITQRLTGTAWLEAGCPGMQLRGVR